jgi:glucosamine-6-phosphate deaminase
VIEPDPGAVARRAADIVEANIRARPQAVLALPAGHTPLGLYAELVRRHREQGLDFAGVVTFNLDEYLGLAGDDPRCFRALVASHFHAHVNIRPENARALDGAAENPHAECAAYEVAIAEAGGLDLAVLGIGADGHVGFNEPGSSLGSRTRPKTLTRETAAANAAGFRDADAVPRVALTMGVGTILSARRCLLLGTGTEKAAVLRAAIEGPVTAQITASALQLHPDATFVIDEDAASKLARVAYYHEMEQAQRALERD